jgi:hypothetical protein
MKESTRIMRVEQPSCPDHVIAERDNAIANDRRSFTAVFMGDPLPGRSAADRKQAQLPLAGRCEDCGDPSSSLLCVGCRGNRNRSIAMRILHRNGR